jgi:anthranilate phosphoribosyltransferase
MFLLPAHSLRLGETDALVFYGEKTIDELSLCGTTKISHLKNGRIRTFSVTPEGLGMMRVTPDALKGGNVRENAQIVKSILCGEKGPKRDMVVLNVAAAFWGFGLDDSMEKGIERACRVIDSGAALDKFETLVRFTQECVPFTLSSVVSA